MNLSDKDLLRRLGSGETIAAVCQAAGITREEFDRWWQKTSASRAALLSGRVTAAIQSTVEIQRDGWGIPHIYASHDTDLFFGFGYAMAQDRLFQLDYLRRKGMGRLSEILGTEGLPLDTIARTVGLNRIAAAEWQRLSPEVQQVLQSFSDGINALIEQSGDRLPIEFDLLDYRPEPWLPVDCLAIENEFRWYLTGRFPVIAIPELARRMLGAGSFYDDFVQGEMDEEPIVHPGEYAPRKHGASLGLLEPVGHVAGDPDAAVGSNNWVISGGRTTTGSPLLASDPHIAFEAVSCWYEAHLCGGSFNVAGMAYVGMPAIMFGRNERVAWGITNNICSLRDLYQERTDPNHLGCFLYADQWEPAREVVETIKVREAEPVTKTIRFSRNGPVVDEILPRECRSKAMREKACRADDVVSAEMGPVTLKWLGAYQGGWLTALLAMDRSASVDQFREALRPWHVPTFSLVMADVDGHIAYQSAGRIPIRKSLERGYRPGFSPEHQWQGLIPFEAMPHVIDPQRGWIASANNRLAPDDYPYLLFGCWSSGRRAMRIRQMIEARQKLSVEDMRDMQLDTLSLRAAELVPWLVAAVPSREDTRTAQAISYLSNWDYRVQSDSIAGAIFNIFFTLWCRTVAAERFDAEFVDFMANGLPGTACRLLQGDSLNWFAKGDRLERIEKTFLQTLDLLNDRFGRDMSQWCWGQLHRMPLKHVLSSRGELAELLDYGGEPVHGDMMTVCNTGSGPDWTATTGAGYRLIADLTSSPPVLMAIDAQSQSGHSASPNYCNQFDMWQSGRYHEIHLKREAASKSAVHTLTLIPREVEAGS